MAIYTANIDFRISGAITMPAKGKQADEGWLRASLEVHTAKSSLQKKLCPQENTTSN
jgi:hypothetical protein